jgi:hypothetical protein
MFITNDFAANDPACQMAMAAYAQRLQREAEQQEAIRNGDLAAIAKWGRTSNWYISDRD